MHIYVIYVIPFTRYASSLKGIVFMPHPVKKHDMLMIGLALSICLSRQTCHFVPSDGPFSPSCLAVVYQSSQTDDRRDSLSQGKGKGKGKGKGREGGRKGREGIGPPGDPDQATPLGV